MRKTSLWLPIILLAMSMVVNFSQSGCKMETVGEEFIEEEALFEVDNSMDYKESVTIQDSADRYVEVSYPVERIVVLWDNPTEVLKALGAADRTVGIDIATKNWVDKGLYPELKDIPVVGSWDEPNYEKIAELEPDAVIMLSSYPPLPDEVQKQLV